MLFLLDSQANSVEIKLFKGISLADMCTSKLLSAFYTSSFG